jgi:hypothetical protein
MYPKSYATFNAELKLRCKRASITKDATTHTLRRTGATMLFDADVPEAAIWLTAVGCLWPGDDTLNSVQLSSACLLQRCFEPSALTKALYFVWGILLTICWAFAETVLH